MNLHLNRNIVSIFFFFGWLCINRVRSSYVVDFQNYTQAIRKQIICKCNLMAWPMITSNPESKVCSVCQMVVIAMEWLPNYTINYIKHAFRTSMSCLVPLIFIDCKILFINSECFLLQNNQNNKKKKLNGFYEIW